MGLTAYSVSNPANQSSKFSLSEGSDWAAAADYSALSLDVFFLSFFLFWDSSPNSEENYRLLSGKECIPVAIPSNSSRGVFLDCNNASLSICYHSCMYPCLTLEAKLRHIDVSRVSCASRAHIYLYARTVVHKLQKRIAHVQSLIIIIGYPNI